MIAAGRVAEDAICRAINKASEMKPQRTPITEGQRKAWKKLAKEFGDDLATLSMSCARDIAEAGIKAQMEEADKLLSNPTVRKAYDRFLFVAELTKDHASNKANS
jgi:predicted hydrocarbon binding protein